MRKLILIMLLPVQVAFAQTGISLDSCYHWTRENYPNLKQMEIWEDITSLKKENIKTAFLPQLALNAQATYQSDVTKVDISVPGISIPTVSKDQYKAYAEFRQTIWDGGLTALNAKLEDAILQSNLNQLEVEMYKLNDQVAQSFFTVLAIGKQNEVLDAQKKVLEEKLKMANSGVKNQVLEKSAALAIEAELLTIDQNQLQLDAAKKSALNVLSLLTGKTLDNNQYFLFDEQMMAETGEKNRPEFNLFASQKVQLQVQAELLDKTRNPKVFGFGQLGYGKPALNMLNDKFDDYYLVGVGVSWNAFDWKKTDRQKQVFELNRQMIDQQQETFNQNINILKAQHKEQISKLQKMIENDQKITGLRTEITKVSGSKLDNGSITTSDFIQDLQAETVAKLNTELHRIQWNEAREKYRLIIGISN